MALNDREAKLVFGFAAILVAGGLVRGVAARWPSVAPGVVVAVPDSMLAADPPGFSGPAALDSLYTDGRMNVNAAGIDQLVLLPGIGPALAGRMVGFRREHGPFEHVEELLSVKGIGPKTLERLRPLVAVD